MALNLELAFDHFSEIIGRDRLLEIAKTRPLRGYWGTAPTGRPHIGYLVPILNLSRLIRAGVEVTILIADYHAALDNNKTEWEALHARTEYYTIVIQELLRLTGVSPDGVRFVKGTSHQRGNPAYLDDLLRLSTKITVNIAKKATAEVVKCSSNPPLSNCIYPLMQVLDEEHLDVDFEMGGVDQRKIFMFGIDYLPRIGYTKSRNYLMHDLISSLSKGGKMSASDVGSKIDLLDLPETIRQKCNRAWSKDGDLEDNGVMELYHKVVFQMTPYSETGVTVSRPEKYGGDVHYSTYVEMERAFLEHQIASVDLKATLGDVLVAILAPLQKAVPADLVGSAYADPLTRE